MTESDELQNQAASSEQSISTPLLVLIRSLRRLTPGEQVEVLTKTESERHEIVRWVEIAGHLVVESENLDDGAWRGLIRKQTTQYQ